MRKIKKIKNIKNKKKQNKKNENKDKSYDKIYTVKACGKLYIGGEYSILTPKQSAIIKNIDIFIKATIKKSYDYKLYSDMFDYSVGLSLDKNYSLIQETIFVMNEYMLLSDEKISEVFPFDIEITGKMEKYGKKYGIGSSGSVVVLVIKAICKLYNIELSSDKMFKLASYVLLKREDRGSMGDIACIVYNKTICYTSFDRDKIIKLIQEKNLLEVLALDWDYEIKEIKIYNKVNKLEKEEDNYIEFLVGWTKEPAISNDMIKEVKNTINEDFLNITQENVELLKKSFEKRDKYNIKYAISEINKQLETINKSIYSKKLKKLVEATKDLDIIAKSSGAGGGDCGIAISFNKNDTKELIKRWNNSDIEVLYREVM